MKAGADNHSFAPAEQRWARFGVYYAMFPVDFAVDVMQRYSQEGDYVIDPFAGRGTSVYAAAATGRMGYGIEINPVGWVYGKTKIAPANKDKVLSRLGEIASASGRFARTADSMPPFFHACFSRNVRKFLLAAKSQLNWRRSEIDATLMSFIALYLHGKVGSGLSNQMMQTKAMSPEYSIRWWKSNGMSRPLEICPEAFLRPRIEWRYAKGAPEFKKSAHLYLGDSDRLLPRVGGQIKNTRERFSLLFTSPPYWSLVNYHADQWLRLWLMGGADNPKYLREKNKGRFLSQTAYRALLFSVFSKCAKMMSKRAIVYVRTDIRDFTHKTTREVLCECFPKHRISEEITSYAKQTQSRLYGNTPSVKPGEIDIIMHPKKY